jgi:flagellar assembly protein FliH
VLSCKFSRKLSAVTLVGDGVQPTFTEADVEAAREEAYKQARSDASAEHAKQLAQHQAEVLDLQRQTLDNLGAQHEALVDQFCEMLPGLVMEAVRRILATTELDETLMKNIVSEIIAEVHPGTSGVEVTLSEHDMEFFEEVEETFQKKYPGIHFVCDRELHPGDCMVRSRFGVLDGSLSTKLDHVEALLA